MQKNTNVQNMNRTALSREFHNILATPFALPVQMIHAIRNFIFSLKFRPRSTEDIDQFLLYHFKSIYIHTHENMPFMNRKPSLASLRKVTSVDEIVGYEIKDHGMYVHDFDTHFNNLVNENEQNTYSQNQLKELFHMYNTRSTVLRQLPKINKVNNKNKNYNMRTHVL